MVPQLEKAGLLFTGKDETGQRMEVGLLYMISGFLHLFWERGMGGVSCFVAMSFTIPVLRLS